MVEVAGVEIGQPVSGFWMFPSLRGEVLSEPASTQAPRGIQGTVEARNAGTKSVHDSARLWCPPRGEGARGKRAVEMGILSPSYLEFRRKRCRIERPPRGDQ